MAGQKDGDLNAYLLMRWAMEMSLLDQSALRPSLGPTPSSRWGRPGQLRKVPTPPLLGFASWALDYCIHEGASCLFSEKAWTQLAQALTLAALLIISLYSIQDCIIWQGNDYRSYTECVTGIRTAWVSAILFGCPCFSVLPQSQWRFLGHCLAEQTYVLSAHLWLRLYCNCWAYTPMFRHDVEEHEDWVYIPSQLCWSPCLILMTAVTYWYCFLCFEWVVLLSNLSVRLYSAWSGCSSRYI